MKTLIKALDDLKLPSNKKVLDQFEIYINEIKRVDYYLKAIYDFIESNYEDDEIVVSLV